ncbi:hypothetical protein CPB86DRAFT_800666 [Serendipita vermifera]|nr:hypothetical protein CPB86DRAFT_800666 [Serendipita vermifera]
MPFKRPVLDLSDKDMDKGDWQVKRQKVVPHRSKLETTIEDILDLLGPATSNSLTDFNEWEKKEERRGVAPIDILMLEKDLGGLKDAKIYDKYSANTVAKSDEVQGGYVEATLYDIIRRIKVARNQLPDIKDVLLRKPLPSDYAAAKNWAYLQTFPNPMLCMRPVECRGLPIFLLHPIFPKYLSLSKKALPATPQAREALQAARKLCNTMGNYFAKEST